MYHALFSRYNFDLIFSFLSPTLTWFRITDWRQVNSDEGWFLVGSTRWCWWQPTRRDCLFSLFYISVSLILNPCSFSCIHIVDGLLFIQYWVSARALMCKRFLSEATSCCLFKPVRTAELFDYSLLLFLLVGMWRFLCFLIFPFFPPLILLDFFLSFTSLLSRCWGQLAYRPLNALEELAVRFETAIVTTWPFLSHACRFQRPDINGINDRKGKKPFLNWKRNPNGSRLVFLG